MTPARLARVAHVAVLLVVGLALVYCAWFKIQGGRWERVETPSMGTTAPVGTLLWVAPVGAGGVHTGEVISFHRPGSGATGPVYSHRVRAVLADGQIETGGDLSGPDQWRVAPSEVVGRVVRIWPGAGWVAKAGPLLLLGGLLTAGARRIARVGRRLPTIMLGCSVTISAAIVVYKPLTGVQQLGLDDAENGVNATFVSTGLLPVRVSVAGVRDLVLHSGQDGRLMVPPSSGGATKISLGPDLPPWFWVLVIGVSFIPSLLTSLMSWFFRRQARRVASGAHARHVPQHL